MREVWIDDNGAVRQVSVPKQGTVTAVQCEGPVSAFGSSVTFREMLTKTDEAQVPPAEPELTIRRYKLLAMRTLAQEVEHNNGKVLAKLSRPQAAMQLNAALGLGSEVGEIQEIYKKYFFHGHDLTAEELVHLKKETGDAFWYLMLLTFAQGWDPVDILQMNIDKLKARYPDGFSTERSLHRAPGDI